MGVSLVLLLYGWAHECMGFILAAVDWWEAAVAAITLPGARICFRLICVPSLCPLL